MNQEHPLQSRLIEKLTEKDKNHSILVDGYWGTTKFYLLLLLNDS